MDPATDPGSVDYVDHADAATTVAMAAMAAIAANDGAADGTMMMADNNCTNEYCVTDEEYYEMIYRYVFPKWYDWIIFCIYMIVFVVGLIGNFLVCYVVLRVNHMQTVTNMFILNLAAGDFMVILICLMPTLLWDTWETWFFGYALCKLVLYLQLHSSWTCWTRESAPAYPISSLISQRILHTYV
ncbi:PREDICTED: orexin receptor type 2-like [Priapulus caudatus]|uniref:Orexin receptor type 2-like n=1 Tax=Priapulus caudatus TaxID=37621 RepID=A0ABM1EH33_PRICU|nr:PREDICTED: orexin receptor type 2-like [Priapulus caudatus]